MRYKKCCDETKTPPVFQHRFHRHCQLDLMKVPRAPETTPTCKQGGGGEQRPLLMGRRRICASRLYPRVLDPQQDVPPKRSFQCREIANKAMPSILSLPTFNAYKSPVTTQRTPGAWKEHDF